MVTVPSDRLTGSPVPRSRLADIRTELAASSFTGETPDSTVSVIVDVTVKYSTCGWKTVRSRGHGRMPSGRPSPPPSRGPHRARARTHEGCCRPLCPVLARLPRSANRHHPCHGRRNPSDPVRVSAAGQFRPTTNRIFLPVCGVEARMSRYDALCAYVREIEDNLARIRAAVESFANSRIEHDRPGGGYGTITTAGDGRLLAVDLDHNALRFTNGAALGKAVTTAIQQAECAVRRSREQRIAEAQAVLGTPKRAAVSRHSTTEGTRTWRVLRGIGQRLRRRSAETT